MTTQDKANLAAYNDGLRVSKKGLGLTASGKYDYRSLERLFARGFRRFCRGLDAAEAQDEFMHGFVDGLHTSATHFECGRPRA